jgi:hypothetical protein
MGPDRARRAPSNNTMETERPMPTVDCTLGTDQADAALNRPVLVLRPEEVRLLRAPAVLSAAPRLAGLLGRDGAVRVVGAGGLAELRAELRRLLSGVTAPRLPGQLPLALSLQRLDTAGATAQEFGLNLYLSVADD